MNKVKVWGEEIDSCISCNYCSAYEPRCLIADIDLWNNTLNVHKDCPFSKPITKEVIERFGFKYIKTQPGTTESYFEFPNSEWGLDFDPNWKGILYIRIYVFDCDGDTTYFAGTINNPVELEFILKSIGVIE